MLGCVMQDDKTGNGPKFANRRSVLKPIGGTTAAGLAVPGIGSAESRSQVSATSGGFSDSEPDNYSGSDPHGTFWYQEYRGFMNSACNRVSEINADDGRVFHEISTCCTSEYQHKHRINGWDKGYFLGGSAVKFSFPDHQVLTPQDGDSPNEWIGSGIDGSGDMADGVSDEAEAAFDLLGDIAPYAYIKDFTDFWNEIAAAQEPDTDYDYKWGSEPTPTYAGSYKIHHWVKFLVEEEPDEPSVSGEIEHTALCGALDNKVHTLDIDATSATTQSESLQKADKETIREKENLLQSVGREDVTIDSVRVTN